MMYVPVESKQRGPPYHHKTVIHGFTQKWQDFTINLRNSGGGKNTLTHSCYVMLSKTSNECVVRNAFTASTVIVQPPRSCCAANMRHPACQLAQNRAGHTDYRLQRFSYSQQNVLDASRRRTFKINTWKQLYSSVPEILTFTALTAAGSDVLALLTVSTAIRAGLW